MECKCPPIPQTLFLNEVNCDGGRIVRAALFCGGPKSTIFWKIGNSRPEQPSLGVNRFTIQFLNGSRFQGSLISVDPGCIVTDGTDIDFTFGAMYTGDEGVETADGSNRPCIVQSKMVFSSFNFDLVGNFIHEGAMKDRLHRTVDAEIVKLIYPRLASATGRCQRWREMP